MSFCTVLLILLDQNPMFFLTSNSTKDCRENEIYKPISLMRKDTKIICKIIANGNWQYVRTDPMTHRIWVYTMSGK